MFVSDFLCFWFPLLLVSLSVVALFFLSGLFLCLLLFWFLSCCRCLLSGLMFSVLRFLALVCFLLARYHTWGVCLSFPSSGNLPGSFGAIFVFNYFKWFFLNFTIFFSCCLMLVLPDDDDDDDDDDDYDDGSINDDLEGTKGVSRNGSRPHSCCITLYYI